MIRAFRKMATWATILLTHRTIMISRDTYARAQRLPFCQKKVRLVFNGISQPAFWPRKEARAALAPNAPQDGVWIGTIAELTPNKALGTLISAAANLRDAGLPFTLVIIGEGDERAALTRLIRDANLTDRVILTGFILDAATRLYAFDIFALVSSKEGLPYVLLEAAEARCAIVASRISGIVDIIDERTGVLVGVKSVKETADALRTLLEDPERRHTLGEAANKKVREQFSLSTMARETARVYLD